MPWFTKHRYSIVTSLLVVTMKNKPTYKNRFSFVVVLFKQQVDGKQRSLWQRDALVQTEKKYKKKYINVM